MADRQQELKYLKSHTWQQDVLETFHDVHYHPSVSLRWGFVL